MVAAKIIFIDDNEKYYIPEKFHDSLGMAWYAPFITVLAKRYEAMQEVCQESSTKNGLDVYFGDFGKSFFDWIDAERRQFVDGRLDKGFLPILQKHKKEFNMALEVGCGSGILANALAKRNPNATIIGIDYADESLRKAKLHAKNENLKNVEYYGHDITSLPVEWTNRFDLVLMFDFLHDTSDPVKCVSEMKRVLMKDGLLVIADPNISSYQKKNEGNVLASAFYSISLFNCLPNSLSKKPEAGLGIGWGFENERDFLISQNLEILETYDFTINEHSVLFACKKIENV
ncbi:hypothetical protein KUTeg_021193 [Tegillarca granosa]|uniref:Methyltransferase domain-containing protein n=1 Tax=Tegillarca granosa TaxID=220873 RepID=A0ABQ9ECR4_TEGGR|nr:hypothetical protein KUTeg_021193 [Tegillarca granosa]